MNPASHRQQLVELLCEAAEIEHCLMCTYLYGAFSLKQDAAEDLEPEELDAVRRWRAETMRIATDEMLHLTLVNNLLVSVGARPHYRRFNFPIWPGLFPADVAVELAPFDAATLDHFVYLERPREAAERDAARYEKSSYRRAGPSNRLMSFNEDYATVGELYETIEASFEDLARRLGEAALFVGGTAGQLCPKDFRLPGLRAIAGLADARAAIRLIVDQGEGSRSETANSHYARFCAMRSEWKRLAARRAAFVPYRPAARNPLMRSPVVAGERVHVVAEPAALLLDAGNACYALMLRLLELMSQEAHVLPLARRELCDQTLLLMRALTEIGSALSALPANPERPGVNAGITFTVSRSALAFQSAASAAVLLAERYRAIAARLDELAEHLPGLARLATAIEGYAVQWGAAVPSDMVAAAQPIAVPLAQPAQTHAEAESPASAKVDVVRGRAVEVRFDHGRCIHARHCVLGEPEVFVANEPGEWIYPDAASPTRIAIVAHNCPSGAITYTPLDGSPGEAAPGVNVVRVRENGPLAFHATLTIAGEAAGCRATLCRCGASRNKPFCDGAHTTIGFSASGEPATRASEPLAARGGEVAIEPLRNGPLEVCGNLEICAGTGRTIDRVRNARLCRCGASRDKPFCDGSHLAAGFVADGR
jgi:CDGSH-type Zn-finger protein/uncharacterized Fe-S cluster protein YjdI